MKRLLLLLLALATFQLHAATVIQSTGNTCNGCGTTLAASFGSLPAIGHDIKVSVGSSAQGHFTITDNQGNTYTKAGKDQWYNAGGIYQSNAIANSSGTFTITVTWPSTPGKANIAIYESTGTPYVDSTGLCGDGFLANVSTTTCTNTSVDAGTTDLVITQVGDSQTAVPTTPTGYTSVAAGSSDGYASAYRINSSALQDAATWPLGTSTIPVTVQVSFGSTPPTVPHAVDVEPASSGSTFTTSIYDVLAGDAILVPLDVGTGTAPTVSDGTSYTQDVWEPQSTTLGSGVWSLFNASAGTHAVVITGTAGATAAFIEVAGLPTTNSLDKTGIATAASGTGPVTATTAALSAATDFAVLSGVVTGFQALTAPSGWTGSWLGSGGTGNVQFSPSPCIYHEQPAATTALSPSCGTISSATWTMAIATYKAGTSGGTCTNNGWSISGAEAIPNGTTGSYWTPSGIFASPNCSSINYWQPPVGLFGPT